MASYDYIESAIILNLDDKIKLRTFKHTEKDFAAHGKAYNWIIKHFDKYGVFATPEAIVEKFPNLDIKANSVNFEYAVEEFKGHVLQRTLRNAVNKQVNLINENPKKAITNLMVDLTDIEIVYDEDVQTFDKGDTSRLEEWRERTMKREMGDGLMGIPTSFKTINTTGVGWNPGELIAAFARPTIGKTWLCVHAAATAVKAGHRTLLISTEMPQTAINMRLDVVLAKMMDYNFSHTALRRGDPIDEELYAKYLKESNTESLLVCDHISGQMGISLESIAGLVRKHNPEFVVIDGVYLVATSDSKKAAWEQSHALFYGLKNLATATNTPIMVSTQATRDASNMFTPPRADQVAFGDALIRAADVAIAMCAVAKDSADASSLMQKQVDTKRLVQFQKYRDGELPRDTTYMEWSVNNGVIHEIPDYDGGGDF
jgi:KaiC/GvpD/RAD55 family RecA-like ATPase